ncbi:DNA-3-methyladenine glycosylase family protein [Nocardioides sp.]|uniref:DNA-3-methyladenine glycosylase family protein n=1 Tax=Nocardioides sp. TaxID=35761 RepID=UPI003D125BAD
MQEQVRVWRPDWPCPAARILSVVRRGGGDPTYQVIGDSHWRGLRTPEGLATLMVLPRSADGEIVATAWGDGATWALDRVPAMLGVFDDVGDFRPRHPVVEAALQAHPHWRIGRTGLVMDSLVPAVIEQKVTGKEAFLGFRRLVQRFGDVAPGAGADKGLLVQPGADRLRSIPSWEWLKLHIDPARSRTIVEAARVAPALERTVDLDMEQADRRLRSVPGIGVWTSAEIRVRAFGDPDAVSFGDYHVAKDIGWALTGKPVDDDQLATLLEPWRPQRYRVQALLALQGLHRPRRGPRMTLPTHFPRS